MHIHSWYHSNCGRRPPLNRIRQSFCINAASRAALKHKTVQATGSEVRDPNTALSVCTNHRLSESAYLYRTVFVIAFHKHYDTKLSAKCQSIIMTKRRQLALKLQYKMYRYGYHLTADCRHLTVSTDKIA